MTEDQPVIEIRDPEINVEEIMGRIRERIRQRRAQAQQQGLDYDKLVSDDSDVAAAGRFDDDVYYDLHQLRSNAYSIWVSLAMRDRRFPLVNPILFRIEKLLHRLAIKYVNMLAGRQVVVNRATAQVLSGIVRASEDDYARLEALQKQVADLRDHLAKLDQPPGASG
jgi:hypothetical protein